ncbi:hypothetical protein HO133_009196 [Letharia lupina]|uniref:Uncharacterized protein n=1 Tax=Letharia lupina TaxID=560253 RepID=A0A8H6CMW2_9LECA|nr:uncharacterized protein HO133_009196 [Letharia lupina]KAF6226330.1 hypothetical protein HO133_009196 [Letharia lupina]
MDPPDSDAMGIDPCESTSTAEDADSSSVESKTREAIITDLRAAYEDLPFKTKRSNASLVLTSRIIAFSNFVWSKNILKKYIGDDQTSLIKSFENLDAAKNDSIWTGDDDKVTAYYKYLLMIATVSRVDVYGDESQALFLLLVLELYHDAPKKYLEMLMIAMKKSFPQWIQVLSHTLKENNAQDNQSSRSRLSKIYDPLASRGSTQLVEQIDRDVNEKKKNSSLFRFYPVHCLEYHLHRRYSMFYAIRGMSPFTSGVNQAIRDVIDNCLNDIADRLRTSLPQDYSLPREVQLQDFSWENTDDVLLLYGVSGSGKTRSIEGLLHEHWGYYLLPGNLSLNQQRDCDNLYDPLRGGYSRDSCLLWQLIENNGNVVPGMDISKYSITEWSRRLILSRHLIFDKFLEVASKIHGADTPANWLRFQKSCSKIDPFETIFRLLLLVNNLPQRLDPCYWYTTTHVDKVLDNKTFIYCLDEAQCYLDTLVPIGNSKTENLLQIFSEYILVYARVEQYQDQRYVVSGTSLELKKTISILESTHKLPSVTGPGRLFTTCKTFTNFPLLTNGDQLAKLIEEDGLNKKIKANPEVLNLIKEHGIRLRGRYLWSVRYVEHLKGHDNLDSTAISTAADSAMREAKESLKKRLSRLRRDNYDAILQELCWVVIQSDLLDRPTIFEKDEDHQMITEAFAVVETHGQSLKGTLKEYLAMDAAREWFREENKDMYNDMLKKYLRFSTNDAASFGKAAEWFLVLELWNCLHHSDRMTGSEGEKRREKILEFLFEAGEDGKEHKASTYHLVEGRNIGYSHDRNKSFDSRLAREYHRHWTLLIVNSGENENPNSGSVVPIWEWMKSIRQKDLTPIASFYFPDNYCGPDIVFSLEPTDSSEPRVLCVLQLKTGAVDDMEKAIRTTNLWMSYEDDDVKGKQMKTELAHWKGATVIRILASTATNHRPDYVAQLVKKEKQEKKEKQQHGQLFRLCDKNQTADLFGEFFTNLIDARTSSKKGSESGGFSSGGRICLVIRNPVRNEKGARRSLSEGGG